MMGWWTWTFGLAPLPRGQVYRSEHRLVSSNDSNSNRKALNTLWELEFIRLYVQHATTFHHTQTFSR